MNDLIRFETFQYISFILSASLFCYMTGNFLRWFIRQVKPPKLSPSARAGRIQ